MVAEDLQGRGTDILQMWGWDKDIFTYAQASRTATQSMLQMFFMPKGNDSTEKNQEHQNGPI